MKTILLLLLFTVHIFAGTMDEAKKLFDNKQYKEALIIFNEYKDNPEAQYYLGKAYFHGAGVEKDEIQALVLLKQSARQGNTSAMISIGQMYSSYGILIKKNYSKTIEWYKKAIEHGDTKAYSYIGHIYRFNLKEYDKAIEWYKKAIEHGDTKAYSQIGYIYRYNLKEYDKAIEWFRQAIKNGNTIGYLFIGDIYYTNLKDYKEALKNYLIYAKNGRLPRYINRGIGYIYNKQKNYKKAYEYFKKAAEEDDKYAMMEIYLILREVPSLATSKDEGINWIKRASKLKLEYALVILSNKGKRCSDQYMNTNEKLYNDGYIPSGCNLASCYSNKNNYIESFNLANEMITKYKNTEHNKDLEFCYIALANLYNDGMGVAKDINKSIEFNKMAFNINQESVLSQEIAKLYLWELNDLDSAEKWYKISYELTNEKKYLEEVFKYKSSLYKLDDENITQKIFPIVDVVHDRSFNIRISGGPGNIIFATSQKEIKIINEDTAKLKNILRGQIGYGKNGAILAMTYDIKKMLLYVANYHDDNSFKKNNIINIYDINSGKIVKSLNNVASNNIMNLVLSDDGKYLLVIKDAGFSLNIINTVTNEIQSYKSSNQLSYLDVIIQQKENDYHVYALDNKNNIHVFSVKEKKVIKLVPLIGSVILDADWIILQKESGKIEFLDYNFTIQHTINLRNGLQFVSIGGSDEKGKIPLIYKKQIDILNIANNQIIKTVKNDFLANYAILNKNNKLMMGTLNNILIYNIKTKEIKKLLEDRQQSISKLSFVNNKLYIHKKNKVKAFDFEKLILLNISNNYGSNKNRTSTKLNIKLNDNNKTIEIYNSIDNRLSGKIYSLYHKIMDSKIINDEYILIRKEKIYIYNKNGKPIAVLDDMGSYQNNIYYKDGYLFTYGNDNIIHIWSLDSLDKINEQYSNKDIYDLVKLQEFKDYFKTNNPLKFLDNLRDEKFKMSKKLSLLKKEIIYPLASLYIKDNKWIIFNRQGLFASSENGKDLIKYHLNQGLKKEAKIIKNDQIFEKFYRPDLIKKILAKEKIDEKIDVRSIILNIKPPKVSIIDKTLKGKKNLELRYKICDAGNGISNISMIRNGVTANLYKSRGFTIESRTPSKDKCEIYKNIITLEPGKNTITVEAFDKEKIISNTSDEITVEANYKIEKKPNLHFLSIAVSNYKDESLRLKYPVLDVLAVQDKIRQQSKALFENIFTYALHDENMTKEKLSKTFDKISKDVDINDVFVMYVAGHGITEDGTYYFLPYGITDMSKNGLKKYGISISEITDKLANINANKSLILLDTCSSGSFVDNAINGKMVSGRLSQASGRNYIAASSEVQVALEGYKNHGIFTYVVLDAFKEASFDDTNLTVFSLAKTVKSEVPKITKEKFLYDQTPEIYLREDFPIGSR